MISPILLNLRTCCRVKAWPSLVVISLANLWIKICCIKCPCCIVDLEVSIFEGAAVAIRHFCLSIKLCALSKISKACISILIIIPAYILWTILKRHTSFWCCKPVDDCHTKLWILSIGTDSPRSVSAINILTVSDWLCLWRRTRSHHLAFWCVCLAVIQRRSKEIKYIHECSTILIILNHAIISLCLRIRI